MGTPSRTQKHPLSWAMFLWNEHVPKSTLHTVTACLPLGAATLCNNSIPHPTTHCLLDLIKGVSTWTGKGQTANEQQGPGKLFIFCLWATLTILCLWYYCSLSMHMSVTCGTQGLLCRALGKTSAAGKFTSYFVIARKLASDSRGAGLPKPVS